MVFFQLGFSQQMLHEKNTTLTPNSYKNLKIRDIFKKDL